MCIRDRPYLPYVDSRPQARGGFTETAKLHALRVDFPPVLLARIPAAKQEALLQVLAQDPRPSYQDDPCRLYGMSFAGFEVKFTVAGDQPVSYTHLDVYKRQPFQ